MQAEPVKVFDTRQSSQKDFIEQTVPSLSAKPNATVAPSAVTAPSENSVTTPRSVTSATLTLRTLTPVREQLGAMALGLGVGAAAATIAAFALPPVAVAAASVLMTAGAAVLAFGMANAPQLVAASAISLAITSAMTGLSGERSSSNTSTLSTRTGLAVMTLSMAAGLFILPAALTTPMVAGVIVGRMAGYMVNQTYFKDQSALTQTNVGLAVTAIGALPFLAGPLTSAAVATSVVAASWITSPVGIGIAAIAGAAYGAVKLSSYIKPKN